jgi:hypothetical protein
MAGPPSGVNDLDQREFTKFHIPVDAQDFSPPVRMRSHAMIGRMYTGPLRLLRALMLSATCVALSFGAHLVGAESGMYAMSLVAVVGLVMITMLLTVVLAALSGQRWTLGRSLVALAIGQVALNAIFTVMLSSHHDSSTAGLGGGSMAVAHGAAALLIAIVISCNEKALDTYFCMRSSLLGSGVQVFSPWRLTSLIAAVDPAATVRAAGCDRRLTRRWQHPGILTDLVVLQCLSRRGPPELALAS